jgi:hypothetical protein
MQYEFTIFSRPFWESFTIEWLYIIFFAEAIIHGLIFHYEPVHIDDLKKHVVVKKNTNKEKKGKKKTE